jgi:hypothetical protein
MIGEQRMLGPSRSNAQTIWQSAEWATRENPNIRVANSTFENTRNLTKGGNGSSNCTPNKICKAWGMIDNDYNDGAVWGFVDGHVSFKTSDGFINGTEFPGYQRRVATWDVDGERYPEWTKGISCMDWNLTPSDSGVGCTVPGEK